MIDVTVNVSIGEIMAGIGSLCAGAAALYTSMRVMREVRSGNETTSGHLQALIESRRVAEIPEEDRTAKERRHLLDVPVDGEKKRTRKKGRE